MSNRTVGFFVTLLCGALLAGGCAKKEMVKSEEPMAPMTKPAETAPVKPAETVKQEPVKEAAIVTEEQKTGMDMSAAEAALEKIYFDFDSFILSPAAREGLKKNADYLLKKNPSVKVQIAGNCDERGSDEYNLALGEKRAQSVLNYLVTLGVPAERLTFISYGEEKPADPGNDEAAWAKNRRAEFFVIK